MQGYLAPPITAVFLLGLFWKRVNSRGALTGLIAGFILGMGKLAIEAYVSQAELTGGLLHSFASFNFLYYSGVLLLISVIIIVAASYSSPAQDEESIAGLTFGSLTAEDKKEIRESWTKADIFLTSFVLTMVLGVYLYFSFWLD